MKRYAIILCGGSDLLLHRCLPKPLLAVSGLQQQLAYRKHAGRGSE